MVVVAGTRGVAVVAMTARRSGERVSPSVGRRWSRLARRSGPDRGSDGGASMDALSTTEREDHVDARSTHGSHAGGVLDRSDLLQTLDHAVTKRVTIVSAPAGSGKTSLLRAWAERS